MEVAPASVERALIMLEKLSLTMCGSNYLVAEESYFWKQNTFGKTDRG